VCVCVVGCVGVVKEVRVGIVWLKARNRAE